MTKNPSASKSSMWMMGVSIGEKIFALGIYIILARFLDIVEFGIVAFSLFILDFMTMIVTSGVREYIVTREKTSKLFINTCFLVVFGLSLIFAVAGYLVTPLLISHSTENSELLTLILQVIVFLPLVSSFNMIQLSILQRDFAFKAIALNNFVSTSVSGVIAAYMAYNGFGAWALVAYRYIQVVVITLLLTIKAKFIPCLAFNKSICKDCYKFSLPLIFSEIFNFCSSRIMEIFVSFFYGPASFALLDIARKFTKIITQVSLTALRPVCLSFISQPNETSKGSRHSEFSVNITFLVIPILILLSIYADGYVSLIFGEQWLEAIPIIQFLGFAALAQTITWYFPLLLIVHGKTKQVFYLNVLFFIISIIGGLLSYQLAFENYIFVQVVIFNLIGLLKIYYLHEKRLISISDIKAYYAPVVLSTVSFAIITYALKVSIFDTFKMNNILDLAFISSLAIVSLIIHYGLTYILFKTFARRLISDVKQFKQK
ncbi:oligosaccharide flippase family protein [Glaciecola sp. 2405UD65-10]|uniref:oligosaccharide flippase family protein n=1 Tax=Glaciecola sp. 2405UD65-10 TaxID=3397244 RepID=UPI003B5B6403